MKEKFVWRVLRNFAMAEFEENVEEMVRTTREAAGVERVRRDETGSPGDETGDKTAATAGDERDSGDRWGNVYGRRTVYITPPVAAVSFVAAVFSPDSVATRRFSNRPHHLFNVFLKVRHRKIS